MVLFSTFMVGMSQGTYSEERLYDKAWSDGERRTLIIDCYSFPHVDVEGHESIVFSPGAGAALNCMLSLVNTVGEDELLLMDQAGMHRSKDPGVGAFTPFYNRQLISRGGTFE
jgi:hypothetical protein